MPRRWSIPAIAPSPQPPQANTRSSPRRDAYLLVGAAGGRPCLGTVHLQRLFQGIAEIIQQFLAGLALGVDTGDFLDPADPPLAVLLDDGGVACCHERPPTRMRAPSRQRVY